MSEVTARQQDGSRVANRVALYARFQVFPPTPPSPHVRAFGRFLADEQRPVIPLLLAQTRQNMSYSNGSSNYEGGSMKRVKMLFPPLPASWMGVDRCLGMVSIVSTVNVLYRVLLYSTKGEIDRSTACEGGLWPPSDKNVCGPNRRSPANTCWPRRRRVALLNADGGLELKWRRVPTRVG